MRVAKTIFLLLGLLFIKEAGAQITADTICIGQSSSHFGIPPIPDVTYRWTVGGGQIVAGQGTAEIDVVWGNNPGYHQVKVSVTNAEGCESDPALIYIFLKYPDYASIKGPVEVCAGTEVKLVGNDGPNLIWNDGKNKGEQLFVVFKDTTVYQVALNGPCENDTFYHHITAIPAPVAAMNPLEDTVKVNTVLDLFYMGSNTQKISWMLNGWEIGNGYYEEYQLSRGGEYELFLIAESGSCSDTIKRKIFVDDDFKVHIPNAFTPNEDGRNDYFTFYGVGWKRFHASIYDRWGEILYSWNEQDVTQGWDGTLKGMEAKMDAYVYKIIVEDFYGVQHKFNGTVTLIR